MNLQDFIKEKEDELSKDYKKVQFEKSESVVLSTNSVSRSYLSEETNLSQEGREVKLSEIGETSSLPFKPNGSIITLSYVPPRKRKAIKKEYYFLWVN